MSTLADRLIRLFAAACPYDVHYILLQNDAATEEARAADPGPWVEPSWLRQDDPPPVG